VTAGKLAPRPPQRTIRAAATTLRPRRSVRYGGRLRPLDVFVLLSGTVSVPATVPLFYLAIRSSRDARNLRRIQYELAGLMRETKELGQEVHQLQREIRREQQTALSELDETKRTVEHVSAAVEQVSETVTTRRRPLLARVRARML